MSRVGIVVDNRVVATSNSFQHLRVAQFEKVAEIQMAQLAVNDQGRRIFILSVVVALAATVAVGTPVTRRPPHRSLRAELPHKAPTSGSDV
jgi:hypothetical protein